MKTKTNFTFSKIFLDNYFSIFFGGNITLELQKVIYLFLGDAYV